MNYLKRLAGQSLVYGLSSVVPRVLNYILVVLHSRVFLPEEYGVVTELYAYIAILLVLLTFGLETGFFRYASQGDRAHEGRVYSTLFWFLACTSGLFFTLCWLFVQPLCQTLGYPGQGPLILMTAGLIAIDAHSAILFARLRLQGRPMVFSGIKIASVIINVGLNALFLLVFPRVGYYSTTFGVGYVLLANLLGSGIAWALALFATGGLPLGFDAGAMHRIMGYSLPLLLSGLGGTTNEFLDRFFIRRLSPAANTLAEVGIYGANVKIAVLLILIIQMFRYAAEPFFFSTAEARDNRWKLGQVTRIFNHTSLFIAAGIYLFLPALKYLVGVNFRAGLGVVPVLLCANLLYGLYFNTSFWYKLTGKTWYALLLVVLGMGVTMGVNWLLTPRISYYGAAWARVGCYSVMTAASLWLGTKHYPVPYNWPRFLKGILYSAVAVALGTLVVPPYPWLSLLWRGLLMLGLLLALLRVEKVNVKGIIQEWQQR